MTEPKTEDMTNDELARRISFVHDSVWTPDILEAARRLRLMELLEKARSHEMTPAEIESQRQSWLRAFQPCEHGKVDFEECAGCRAREETGDE